MSENNNSKIFYWIIIILLSAVFVSSYLIKPAYIVNENINNITIEDNGGLAVNVQDQTTPPFDLYFIQPNATPTTLSNNTIINSTQINLTSTVGFVDGCYVGVFCPDENRFYFGEQIGNAVGNTINLDTPIDFNFNSGDNVLCFSRNLNVDGSTNTQIYEVQGPGGNASIDITRIMIQITTDNPPDFSAFGDIAGGLINGIALRRFDGDIRNIFNIKLNQEFALHAFDYTTYSATNPAQGVNGLSIRYTFAGQDKHGVAVRLSKGESLELWVQDDLSDLLSFRILAEGHIVQD